jgi:general secretion pathway protein D
VELLDDFNRGNALSAPKPPARLDVADWLVVTASPSTLRQVESFVELFAARVPQVEITASVLEVTFSDDFDYGITGPDGEVLLDFPDGTFVDTFGYNMPNSIEGAEGVLSIGAIQDGVALNAFLEAVQRWENVEIRTNPRIVVREGVTAEIQNQTEIPVFSFTGINVAGNFNVNLQFKSVGTSLYITPRVMGSDTLALNMYLEASQQIGTSVAFTDQEGNEFRAPLIANRLARTVVYLRPEQAVVIGGLSSERVEEAETQVPILGDLPLIGYLFKSVRKRRERTLVMFLISPRVLRTQEFYEDMWPGVTLEDR